MYLECPTKAHIWKVWALGWHYWERVATWRGSLSGSLQCVMDIPLKEIVVQSFFLILSLPGHEVSDFSLLWYATSPQVGEQKGQLIIDWHLQNCEPKYIFSLIGWLLLLVTVMESWAAHLPYNIYLVIFFHYEAVLRTVINSGSLHSIQPI
jgi:hypothetical protein